MKSSSLKDPIVYQVLLLLCVSFMAMGLLLLTNRYMLKRVDFLGRLTSNERVKVELSYLSNEKLQTIRVYFQNMSLGSTEEEFQIFTKKIDVEIKQLRDILSVIEHGGSVSHLFKVHVPNTEDILRSFVYHNYYTNRINLEVIEIKAKLVEIERYVSEIGEILSFTIPHEQRLSCGNMEPSTEKSNYRQLVTTYKALDPFFDRLMEHAYQIYFDADLEMRKLQQVKVHVGETFQKRIFFLYLSAGLIILGLGWIVLRNIGKILKENKAIQVALQASNDTLEAKIFERTEALQEEVYVRVQAEIEQRTQAEFLKTVIDSLDHPFYVVDVNTHAIQMLNKAAYALGPDQTSFCYAMTHHRTTPCSGDEHPCPIIEIKKTNKPVIMEHIHYGEDLKKLYVEVHGYPIFDSNGKLLQIIEYSLDVTKKKLAEKELEETNKNLEEIVYLRTKSLEEEVRQREKLQLVVEQNPSTIVITDLNGNIEYVNKQFENVTGYTKEEVLGQNPKMLNSGLTPPETYLDMWESVGKGKIWNGEFINKTRNGDIYHENVLLAPLKNTKGEVTNYVAIKENITELKQAREDAEASSRAKSQFLSRMSHELRTPLNAINGFSELLLTDNKRSLDKRQAEQVLQINIAGQHLLELINEILDISRLESEHFTMSLQPITLADAVADCIALTASLAEKERISITMDSNMYGLPHVLANMTRMKQVILNLLSNAIKYNRCQGTVSIQAMLEGDMVCLQVADSGIGITEEKLKDLFVPFSRLGQDETDIEGTGIGLSITKHLVRLMHGTLEVQSDVNVGTVVCVRIPVVEDDGRELSLSDGENASNEKSITTVLYIEDDLESIQIMRSIVEQWPEYSLIIRKSGKKGVNAVSMLKPDLIVMNLQLADMAGHVLLAELNTIPEIHSIPVIGLSADTLPETKQKYLDSGLTFFLVNPIHTNSLQMAFEKCVKS